MVTAKKVRLVNPHRPRAARKAAPKRKANPGPLYVLGAINPHAKEKRSMSATKKHSKKRNAARKNPHVAHAKKNRHFTKKFKPSKRYKRNPSLGETLKEPVEFLKFGLVALLGLVATRQVPQMALGTKNTSWAGYGANLLTALAGAWGTGKVAGPRAALAFGTGGGLYTVNRILTDKLTPVGQVLSLSGLGDVHAIGTRNLGKIPGAVYPPTYDSKGNLVLPPAFVSAVKAALPPPAPAGAAAASMSGTRISGQSRIAA